MGLLLLPSDYRAGAETAHAHALAHLWADAADGSVHHHHGDDPSAHQAVATNWFAPEVHAADEPERLAQGSAQPDIGERHDSAPATSGLHFLVDLVPAFAVMTTGSFALAVVARRLAGRCPQVLIPPPRWTAALA